jgi:hypothetical protein
MTNASRDFQVSRRLRWQRMDGGWGANGRIRLGFGRGREKAAEAKTWTGGGKTAKAAKEPKLQAVWPCGRVVSVAIAQPSLLQKELHLCTCTCYLHRHLQPLSANLLHPISPSTLYYHIHHQNLMLLPSTVASPSHLAAVIRITHLTSQSRDYLILLKSGDEQDLLCHRILTITSSMQALPPPQSPRPVCCHSPAHLAINSVLTFPIFSIPHLAICNNNIKHLSSPDLGVAQQ